MRDERNNALTEQERRVRDAIRSSGEVRAGAAFRERLKREFSSGTISEPVIPPETSAARGFPRWAWALLPAAAAILLFAVFWPRTSAPRWSIQATHGEGQIEIEGQTFASNEPELVARALSGGGRVKLADGVGLDLRLGDSMILQLDEGSEVTLPAIPAPGESGPLVSEVHAGELRIKTGPAFPGTVMHILTAEGRTEITGTIVSVYKGYDYTCVCVLEGTALVGPDETRLEEISEGLLMVMFGEDSDPLVLDISEEHEADLLEFEELYRDVFEPSQ